MVEFAVLLYTVGIEASRAVKIEQKISLNKTCILKDLHTYTLEYISEYRIYVDSPRCQSG